MTDAKWPAKNSAPSWSPYLAIKECKGESDTSGINWSFAKFANAVDREMFIKLCTDNGYRTRQVSEQAGYYFVQYHHYAG